MQSVFQGRVCLHKGTCFHTEINVADHTPSYKVLTPGRPALALAPCRVATRVPVLSHWYDLAGETGLPSLDLLLSRPTPYHWTTEGSWIIVKKHEVKSDKTTSNVDETGYLHDHQITQSNMIFGRYRGSQPECCISSMIYSRDTPFWSGTLDMFRLLVILSVASETEDTWYQDRIPVVYSQDSGAENVTILHSVWE